MADTKISALTELNETPNATDVFPIVDTSANATKKVTYTNLLGGAYKPNGTDVAVADGGTGASDASGARTNLGLVIGTDVQAYSSVLANTTASFTTADETKLDGIEALADVTDTTNVTAAGALMDSEVTSLSGIKTLTIPDNTTISTFGASLVDDTDASTARTTLGLTIGTNVLAYDAGVQQIADLADPNADRLLFWDDSASAYTYLTVGTGLSITDTTLSVSGAGTGDFLANGSVPMTGDINLDGNNIDNGGVIFLKEQAAADADVAGSGQIWVKTATPNQLWFTDDAGTDIQLGVDVSTPVTLAGEDYLSLSGQQITANPIDLDNLSATGTPNSTTFLRGDNTWAVPAGSGDVSKVGTPVDGQIGVWTGDGTIEGDSALTFDTTTDSLVIAASGNLLFGAVTILDDNAGTMTLSNIDALDATTEATIESAIDTLANLTSIQGRTVTLADAGTNAVFGWDDVAGAYENLTASEVRGAIGLATTDSPVFSGLDLSEGNITNAGIINLDTLKPDSTSGGLVIQSNDGTTVATFSSGSASSTNVSFAGAVTATGGTVTLGTVSGAIDAGGATSFEVPNGAGGTTVNATGEVTVDSTSRTFNFYDGTTEAVVNPVMSKSITIESPTATEDISMFYTDDAITITKIVFVITGSTSVTTTIRHHTDRSNAGNEVVTSGTVANSTTTGNVVTSFNDATIPADSFVWVETTALSGTPTSLNITVFYRQDA